MDVVVLMAADRAGKPVGGCRFEYSIDGGETFSAAQQDGIKWSFAVPSASQLDSIVIRGTPTSPDHWEAEGAFKADESGAIVAAGAPPEFFFVEGTFVMEGPAGTERTWGTHTVTVIFFHLSIFRDSTQSAFEALLTKVEKRPNTEVWWTDGDLTWPPKSWSTALPEGEFNVVTPEVLGPTPALVKVPRGRDVVPPPLVVPPLSFTRGRYSPRTTEFVLERKQKGSLPKAFLVSWPKSLRRTVDASPTPFLVYFTHLLNQNFDEKDPGSLSDYPFGWEYLYFAMYSYLNYRQDPLRSYSRGLLYQIAASQKQLVLVIPIGDARLKDSREVGDCLHADLLEELLEEIQSFCFRAAGLFRSPVRHVGRVALASFSSGNEQLAHFLAREGNKTHRFYKDTLREVYSFDMPRDRVAAFAAHAWNWASVGENRGEKVIRMYGTSAPAYAPVHQTLLGKPAPSEHAYVASTTYRTVAVLPEHSWKLINPGPEYKTFEELAQQAHQLFCGTMLTDALRRSPGF